MTIKRVLLSLATILCAAPPAAAQPIKGFFAGPVLGVGIDQDSHEYTDINNNVGKNSKITPKFALGVSAGYIYQISNSKIVAGFVTDILMNTGSYTGDLRVPGNSSDGKFEIKPKYTMKFAGITGAMLNPKVCVYGKLGYAWTRLTMNYRHNTYGLANFGKWAKGLIPGVGAMYFLDKEKMICGEYGYFLPGKITPQEQTGSQPGYAYTLRSHLITVKLLWLF